MSTMVSQITNVSIACSTVSLGGDQRKHLSSASLAGEFPVQKATNAENVSTWWRDDGELLKRWWDSMVAKAICDLMMSSTPTPERVPSSLSYKTHFSRQ